MPVVEKFTYSWPPGVTPMTQWEWINQLPEADRERYEAAAKRQHEFRSQAIEQGAMTIEWDDNAYVWKDRDAACTNKPCDPEWLEFWDRYLSETQTIFKSEFVDIDE